MQNKPFLCNIDLNGNIILNVRLQQLPVHPSGKKVGFIYYNTVQKKVYYLSDTEPDTWDSCNYIHPNHTGEVTSNGDGEQTITPKAVTNEKLADVSNSTIKGRKSAGTGSVEDLTPQEVKQVLGLENVTNDAQVKAIADTLVGYIPTWSATTGDKLGKGYAVETTLQGSADAIPRADAVKIYIDSLLTANDAMIYKGSVGVGGLYEDLPTTIKVGWAYRIITKGTYAGVDAEAGDLFIALVARTDEQSVAEDWDVLQTNLDGAVVNAEESVVDKSITTFDGTTGKVIKSSRIRINENGDLQLPAEGNIYVGDELFKTGKTGSAFITDITAVNATSNVGSKVKSSDGIVLDSCVSDTNLVRITVIALPGTSNYKPNLTLYWGSQSQAVPLTAQADKPLFSGSINIDLGSIPCDLLLLHEDGAQHIVNISADVAPVITNAVFTGNYPGSQSELKLDDLFGISITSSLPIVNIEFADYGAYKPAVIPVTSGTNQVLTHLIANRGVVAQMLGAKVRVQKSTGSWSAWYLTESGGNTEKVHLVKLNNLRPSIVLGDISYPSNQGALKNVEDAYVVNNPYDYTTISYSSPNGELTIPSSTVYAESKKVTRLSGTYNVGTNNLRVTVVRAENNSSTFAETIVRIANVAASISIITPTARLRSGGNDGTSVQEHTITISTSQLLYQAPTLGIGAKGSWVGAGFTGAGLAYTRKIAISDEVARGLSNWGALSAVNLAGIETTTPILGETYTVGGFVPRVITLPAYQNQVTFNVPVVDYTKLRFTWSIKPLVNQRPVGTTNTPDANSWSISALGVKPVTGIILDTATTLNVSSPSTITIEELI